MALLIMYLGIQVSRIKMVIIFHCTQERTFDYRATQDALQITQNALEEAQKKLRDTQAQMEDLR